MSREIKFRVWDKKNKRMLEVSSLTTFPENYIKENKLKDNCQVSCYFRKKQLLIPTEAILMHFTGLLDKNSKEIYEGDILRSKTLDGKEHFSPVIFSKGSFCMTVVIPHSKNKINSKLGHHSYEDTGKLIAHKIVGTVYENPELIKS